MAQSRLEKIGTIFSRVSGLLRSGAVKQDDKPIWYEVYAAFPPKLEPRFDRPAPNIPIRKIFYEEDAIRAKYQKSNKQLDMINMQDVKFETQTQQFIKIYNQIREQGALDDEQIFETAKDLLTEQTRKERTHFGTTSSNLIGEIEAEVPIESKTLSQNFSEAINNREAENSKINVENEPKSSKRKESSKPINIENLFKD